MDIWSGSIALPDGAEPLYEVHISSTKSQKEHASILLPPETRLSFLDIVYPSRIPLYLAAGPSLAVWTQHEETQARLSDVFLQDGRKCKDRRNLLIPWWETGRAQADYGILLRVEGAKARDDCSIRSREPRITELLLYGMVGDIEGRAILPTPPASSSVGSDTEQKEEQDERDFVAERAIKQLTVHALPLSSDLLHKPSPVRTTGAHHNIEETETNGVVQNADPRETIEPQFLPLAYPSPEEAQPTLKRRRAESLLDDVAERRKKVKKSRDQQTSAIDNHHNEGNTQQECLTGDPRTTSQARHSMSLSDAQAQHTSSNGASREPSSIPFSRCESTQPSKSRPTTSRKADNDTQNSYPLTTAASPCPRPIETQNKDALSKIVMAGLRIYGLQPSKRSSGRRKGSTSDETTRDVESTEEYKLIYHQTFKGVCFALRRSIQNTIIKQEYMRDVVDRLLSIFCGDPFQTNNPCATHGEISAFGQGQGSSSTAVRTSGGEGSWVEEEEKTQECIREDDGDDDDVDDTGEVITHPEPLNNES